MEEIERYPKMIMEGPNIHKWELPKLTDAILFFVHLDLQMNQLRASGLV